MGLAHYVTEDWEDDLNEDVRMGRLSEEDAKVFENLFKISPSWRLFASRKLYPNWQCQVMQHRANVIGRSTKYGHREREVVMKVVSTGKSRKSIRNMLNYIAKPREDEGQVRAPKMHDQFCMPLDTDEWPEAFRNWDLLYDDENARKSVDPSTQRATGPITSGYRWGSHLYRVQAYHFIFSINRREDDPFDLNERLRVVVGSVIDRAFTAKGHKVLWALHEDVHAHPHIHAVVMACSNDGKCLRIDKTGDYFDYLRMLMAERLRAAGVDCTATRRVDRAELRREILLGLAPLKDSWHIRDYKRPVAKLIIRAPQWHADAMAFLDKKSKEHENFNKRKISLANLLRHYTDWKQQNDSGRGWCKKLDPRVKPLAEACCDVYQKPAHVYGSLVNFVAETPGNGALSGWIVERHAELFGVEVAAPSSIHARKQRVVNELRVIESSVDFSMLRRRAKRKHTPYDDRYATPESWPELRYQRRKTIESIMRVAANCRTILDDEDASQRVRVELLVSLSYPLSAKPRLFTGQVERCILRKWTAPQQVEITDVRPDVTQRTPSEVNEAAEQYRRHRSSRRKRRGWDR